MVEYCSVCKKQPLPNSRRSFHRFPLKDENRLNKWLTIMGLSRERISRHTKICSDHFEEKYFSKTTKKRMLVKEAIPTIDTAIEISAADSYVIINSINQRPKSCDVLPFTKYQDKMLISEEVHDASFVSVSSSSDRCTSNNQGDLSISPAVHCASSVCTISRILDYHGSTDVSDAHEVAAVEDETDSAPAAEPSVEKIPEMQQSLQQTKFRSLGGLSRNDFKSESAWNIYQANHFANKKRFKILNKKLRRRKHIDEERKRIVKELRKNQHSDMATFMEDLPDIYKDLIHRVVSTKGSTAAYSREIKSFALRLHAYGEAAYEFVRNKFLKFLPSQSTIDRWMAVEDFDPGELDHIIDAVSDMTKVNNKLIFGLVFDEMHIKKQEKNNWNFHNRTWTGVVETGGLLVEVDEQNNHLIASKALVFMIVALNAHFKAPVSYYLIDSANAANKKEAITKILGLLHAKNINIVSLTFDGDSAHTSACNRLGASLDVFDDNFKPWFDHPITKEPVYIFYDPCHMMKLVRNYFSDKGPFFIDNKQINWKIIKDLHAVQTSMGVHCANKLNTKHIYFHNEKMKVNLAVQVLSSSVAKALMHLEYLYDVIVDENEKKKFLPFVDSSATADFCQNLNDIFDLLNSKQKYDPCPTRNPVTKENLNTLKIKTNNFINYIKNLQFDIDKKIFLEKDTTVSVGTVVNIDHKKKLFYFTQKVRTSVLKHPAVRTGFTGLIISLTSLNEMCKKLLETNSLQYFLSYKISQDHLELFFCSIRRLNGFSNNPTTIQFKSAIKKLLYHKLDNIHSEYANCTPQDMTEIFILKNKIEQNYLIQQQNYKNKQTEKALNKLKVKDHINFNLDRDDVCIKQPSKFIDEIVKHYAGKAVLKIKRHQGKKCPICLSLVSIKNSETLSNITKLKNWGNLNQPSNEVHYICHVIETVVRENIENIRNPGIHDTIFKECSNRIPHNIFPEIKDDVHNKEHCFNLINNILYDIIGIRVAHTAKVERKENDPDKTRFKMKSNKLTFFCGQ